MKQFNSMGASSAGTDAEPVMNAQPLHLIVGDHERSPCSHETFRRFKLWIAKTLTRGTIDTYRRDDVTIEHWDEEAGRAFPHLLNPCECGTYLPIEVEPGPMLSSAIGLTRELAHLKQHADEIAPEFRPLIDALLDMAQRSLETNTALEIR